MDKEFINPSRLAKYNRCNFLYYVTYELNRTVPRKLPDYLMFGSLFHTGAWAWDTRYWTKPRVNWRKAIDEEANKIRTSTLYVPEMSKLLDHLVYEVKTMMVGDPYRDFEDKVVPYERNPAGGYAEWRQRVQDARGWEIVSLEQRYAFELNSIMAAPCPDGVIREKGNLWVLERKSTQQDVSGYEKRYRVSPQTTLEVMAVEHYYDEPVAGVYILPTVYTRKKSNKWKWDLPQPLHRVTFKDPWPIGKSKRVKAQMEMGMAMFMEEIEEKRKNGRWIQNTGACVVGRQTCELYDVCWGRTELSQLPPRPDDAVTEALYRLEE